MATLIILSTGYAETAAQSVLVFASNSDFTGTDHLTSLATAFFNACVVEWQNQSGESGPGSSFTKNYAANRLVDYNRLSNDELGYDIYENLAGWQVVTQPSLVVALIRQANVACIDESAEIILFKHIDTSLVDPGYKEIARDMKNA